MPLFQLIETTFNQMELQLQQAKQIIDNLQKQLKEKTDELTKLKQSSNKNTDPKSS